MRIVGGNSLPENIIDDNNRFLFPDQNVIIPVCFDKLNGKYLCECQITRSGVHRLHVRLLSTSKFAGGNGLSAIYFNEYEGSSDVMRRPVIMKIDSYISFIWPNGIIIPTTSKILTDSIGILSLHNGQSVAWEGYLVSPKSDLFHIFARVENLNVTIFIDDFLIFDSISNILKPLSLEINAAYHLRIDAKTNHENSDFNRTVSISFVWFSSNTKISVIPQFYLYDSAINVF